MAAQQAAGQEERGAAQYATILAVPVMAKRGRNARGNAMKSPSHIPSMIT